MPPNGELPELRFTDWKNLDTHLVWIYEGVPEVPAGFVSNTSYAAWYLRAGSLELEDGACTVKSGQWVILPPGRFRRQFSPRARILSISFQAKWVTGHLLFDFKQPLVFSAERTRGWLAPATPMLRLVRRHYPEAYSKLPAVSANYGVYAQLQGNFQLWLARVWEVLGERGEKAWLPPFEGGRALEMKRWLDAWPLHQPLRLAELAGSFSLSVNQTNRVFCAAFETTPKRYYGQRRLGYAKGALRSTARPVKEISYATGFRHLSEFSVWFKSQTGRSPSDYRERTD